MIQQLAKLNYHYSIQIMLEDIHLTLEEYMVIINVKIMLHWKIIIRFTELN